MTSISSNGAQSKHDRVEETAVTKETAVIERIKKRARARRLRAAQALAAQMQVTPDGDKTFIRFTSRQRLEHQFLIVTFTTLAITGLLQRYSAILPVGWVVNMVFGGVETLRTLHHLAAVLFIFESVYHLVQILTTWFVKRERGAMWPQRQDLRDFVQMVKYNLGRATKRPDCDRFNFEEKIEYWALLWGTAVMILTGLIQWFPIQVTLMLPGDIIPVSRAVHGWEAVLAALSVLIWHIYHTVLKEKNKSIFTGIMTEEEMQETHLVEYRRILAAHAYLRNLTNEKKVNTTTKYESNTQKTQRS